MLGHSGFMARRWRGEVALGLVLWRDMVGVGSMINLLASLAALILATQGLDLRLAVALHFAPLPYNLFLFLVVWRSPQRGGLSSLVAVVWMVLMTFV